MIVIINSEIYRLYPYGYCACGCGKKTTIAKRNGNGRKKGHPVRFITGHHVKGKYIGDKHPNWKGGRFTNYRGYVNIYMPSYPRASSDGYVHEHILVAEKAFGKLLPPKAVVHHHTPEQLVICQDQGYHLLLHQRMRALRACGHSHWLRCPYCKSYGDPQTMYVSPKGHGHHRECSNAYSQVRLNRLKLAMRAGEESGDAF